MSREQYNAGIDTAISKVGWAVTAVMPDILSPGFAYTTGLTEKNMPELIIVGALPARLFGEILNIVAGNHLERGVYEEGLVEIGMSLPDGVDLRAYLKPVDNIQSVREHYAQQTHNRYRNKATYWQVLWADENNVLPNEPGYNSSMTQRVL